MNKNTLLVLAIIIIPIVIMGSLAVAGAGNYPQDEGASEGENHNENTTEGAEIIVPVEMVKLPQLTVDAVDLERLTA